jgi:hypothetical protein
VFTGDAVSSLVNRCPRSAYLPPPGLFLNSYFYRCLGLFWFANKKSPPVGGRAFSLFFYFSNLGRNYRSIFPFFFSFGMCGLEDFFGFGGLTRGSVEKLALCGFEDVWRRNFGGKFVHLTWS